MNQLTRRNFLKALAGLPALALLKPGAAEEPELDLSSVALDSLEDEEGGYLELVQGDKTVYFTPIKEEGIAVWNGSVWARLDNSLEFGQDGSLYIRGNFLEETPEEVRQRITALT